MTSSNATSQENQAGGNSTNPVQTPHPEVPPLPPTPTKMNAPQNLGIKRLLPVATFFFAFATVMTLLVLYMNNKALRHHQFNVNMTQEYDMLGVAQDNPELILVIKSMFLQPAIEPQHKPIEFVTEDPNRNIGFILKLLNYKENGSFIEAGAYSDGKTSKTEWLEKRLSWHGLLIQQDPRHFFMLRRHNRANSQCIHGCLSPHPYPKEITYQEEHDGVKINSVHPSNIIDDGDVFNTRVKCWPLYSLMLATNLTQVDYLSLESQGTELHVLQTLPYDKVKIHLLDVSTTHANTEKATIKDFLALKNYTLEHAFDDSMIFRLI